MTEWCDVCQAPDELCVCEALDTCDRCNGALAAGTGAYVVVHFGPSDVQEWQWCDECTDGFTAWRLGPDVTIDDANLDAGLS